MESEPRSKIARLDVSLQVNDNEDSSEISSKSFENSELNSVGITVRDLIEKEHESEVASCSRDLLNFQYEEKQKFGIMEQSLREFDILDETRESDDSASLSDYLSDSDSDVSVDELERMLEEGLPEELRGRRQVKSRGAAKEFVRKLKERSISENKGDCPAFEVLNENYAAKSVGEQVSSESSAGCSQEKSIPANENQESENKSEAKEKYETENEDFECRSKTVLEEIELNHFDLLPEGWIKLIHKSGMPVYLHRPSRACTMSRPYHLGPGSARNHSIPLSAIPCFSYKQALENERKNSEQVQNNVAASSLNLQSVHIETAAENQAAQSLDPLQLREYCSSLFNFKTINCVKYKSWVAHRKLTKQKKQEAQQQRLLLPGGTKLLRFPIIDSDKGSGSRPHREWIMNPAGKSYVCILHEYLQHALKKQPSYEFKELENPATPYSATVCINGMPYGTATGTSKKQAKLEAAKVALEILIPDMKNKLNPENSKKANKVSGPNACVFDEIKIEDPRVAEFCSKTTEPSPYAILLTCLQRNYALTKDVKVEYTVTKTEHRKSVFNVKIVDHEAVVTCRNKREAKQMASQQILQTLHPHITNWGSLLRLYGNGNSSVKNVKDKKKEEQEITLLQSKATTNQPNTAILNKLHYEMRRLKAKKMAVKPIGKFIPSDDIVFTSLSSSDLNKISL